MPRALQKVVSEQQPDVAQDLTIAGRVQAVTAEVDSLTGHFEAGRVAADEGVPFDDGHFGLLVLSESEGRAEAGWSGPEDDDMGL
jgi:hypothetical protein